MLNMGLQLFSFSLSTMLVYCWLASRVAEMNLISLKNGSFEANLFLKNCLCSVFCTFTIVCLGRDFFMFILIGIYWASKYLYLHQSYDILSH